MSRTSSWIALAVASLIVIVLIGWMAVAWTDFGDGGMSAAGWFAMALGIFVTLALGIGLMALVFISNRRGYDERSRHGR